MLGLLLACIACDALEPRAGDVVIVTLDTTRRDHLGCYGYGKQVSPNIDAFARRSDLYRRAYASSSWTLPTHASILTGLYPTDHGAQMTEIASPEAPRTTLTPEVLTLAEMLSARGFATGAFIGALTLERSFGLAQGFDVYDADFDGQNAGDPADEVTRRALDWVRAQRGRRIFLLVNYFDPHKPYRPPDPCHSRFAAGVPRQGKSGWYQTPLEQQLRLYDAEICFMDQQFGELIRALEDEGRLEDALVAVTSDHGEAFGERGHVGHARNLLEPLIHVPLIVKRPGQRDGREVDSLFETRELFHVALEAAKVPLPDGVPGRSTDRAWVLSELMRGVAPTRRGPYRALVRWPWKLVRSSREGESELFDLSTDPAEEKNLIETRTDVRAELDSLLDGWLAERRERDAPAAEVDPGLEERLRALGYGS